MKHYLATTGLSEIWDLKSDPLLLLGPWCLADKKNQEILKHRRYALIPSPWKPASKLKEAADYCYSCYEEMLPCISDKLNSLHNVSYPLKYWRTLIGPWFLHFLEVLYDRYSRIEKALELYPGLYTHVLPEGHCDLASYDTHGFLFDITLDHYNLKIFSFIARELFPERIQERGHAAIFQEAETPRFRFGWKRKLINKLIELSELHFNSPMALANMYHLSPYEIFILKCRTGFNAFRFVDFESMEWEKIKGSSSAELRKKLLFNTGEAPGFKSLAYKMLPHALPVCYVENYALHKKAAETVKNTDSIKTVGSSVGWFFAEKFKFFVAEKASQGARLIEFQHGGGYGSLLVDSREALSLEKDIFYTWGWNPHESSITRVLPNPHLSRIKNTHTPKLDNLLFVDAAGSIRRYHYRFHSVLLPDDMPEYLKDKKIFFQALSDKIKEKILYRPYLPGYEWNQLEVVKNVLPDIKFALNGQLASWMQKAKLVVVDHAHTSYIEALTVNAPTIFYWNHDVYLMRPEAEKCFKLLRDAGVLFEDPLRAAEKVNEVFDNPQQWWNDRKIQDARSVFCEHFAYSRKNWKDIWVEELKHLKDRRQ